MLLKYEKRIPQGDHLLKGCEYWQKNRTIFSKWMFNLHNLINKMLNKEITLTYNQVRNSTNNSYLWSTKKSSHENTLYLPIAI